jgi:AraC-like DNA-binding protein
VCGNREKSDDEATGMTRQPYQSIGGVLDEAVTMHPRFIHEVPAALLGVELEMWQTGPAKEPPWAITQTRCKEVAVMAGQMAGPYAANLSAQTATIFVLQQGGPWLINGCRVNSGEGSFFEAGADANVASAGACSWYAIQFSEEQLRRYSMAMSGKPLISRHAVKALGKVSASRRGVLPAKHLRLSTKGKAQERSLVMPAALFVQRQAWCLLAKAIGEEGYPLRSGHERIARQAMNYLQEQKGSVVGSIDLCLALRISDRWLREAFMHVYGVTATKLLRLRRLHQARVALLTEDTTVTAVASSLDFHDFGRFAQTYLYLFGEHPSATLRRK